MKKYLLLTLVVSVFTFIEIRAQGRTVSGKITSVEGGEVLPGVNILEKGTTNGTISDIEGKYTLNVSEGAILVYSFIGYVSEEGIVGDKSIMDVQLSSDIKQLSEVVVTAIGIEREKKALGYSVQEIESDDITKADNSSGFINALQGKVAGLQVTSSSGNPGASTRLIIRGITSISKNNQPLFVIDGVPIDNSNINSFSLTGGVDGGSRANDINPEDIKSVSFLKGAAASSLYGSRGANGVIIVTTKTGRGAANRNKKAEISYSGNVTFSNPLVLPEYQNTFAGGTDGMFSNTSGNNFGPRASLLHDWVYDDEFGGVSQVQIFPDNLKDFYETGVSITNNLSMAGGDENTDYRFSFGHVKSDGMVPNTGVTRQNFSVNAGHKFSNKVSSRTSVTYSETDTDNAPTSGQTREFGRTFNFLLRNTDLNAYKEYENPDGTQRGPYLAFFDNPYWTLNKNIYEQKVRRLRGNVTIDYNPLDWLKLTVRSGIDSYSDNRFKIWAVGSQGSAAAPEPQGRIFEDKINVRDMNHDFLANVNTKITGDLDFSTTVGFNIRERTLDRATLDGFGLAVPEIYDFSNITDPNNLSNDNTRSIRRQYGVYATTELGYKNFLFLGLSARNDWSSTLPEDNNSYFYPGVNASFVFTDAFDIDNKIFSFGKIRANWSQAGLDADPYEVNTFFEAAATRGFLFDGIQFPITPGGGGLSGTSIPSFVQGSRTGDPQLQPEITTEIEVGTDLRFFQNRLGLDFSYYSRNSTDQILDVQIPNSTGFRSFTTNSGELENKGIELVLNGTPIKTKSGLEWNVSLNFARNRNKLLSIANGVESLRIFAAAGSVFISPDVRAQVGEPYGVIRGTVLKRDDQGRLLLNDDGLPQIEDEEQTIGNVQADYILGLRNSLSYKGISASVFFQTEQGGDVYSYTQRTLIGNGMTLETLNGREEGIIPDGIVESTGAVAEELVSVGDYNNALGAADETYLFDGSYIKLRELRVSYRLPQRILDKTPFGNVELAVIGNNLLIFGTNIPHIDPEVGLYGSSSNRTGIEFGNGPSARTYGFNLRFTL